MPNPLVIDLSHWQSSVDFAKLKANGTQGVILKATQGTGSLDPTFTSRYLQAKQEGLLVSTYHYLTSSSAVAQMEYYLSVVKPSKGDRMCIDYEDDDLTIKMLEDAAEHLLTAADVEVTVYGANGKLGADLGGKKNNYLADNTSLWVASYTSAASPTVTNLKATWPVWSLWQYSQSGTAIGVTGPIDSNRWNGDAAALPGWFHRDVAPTPEPAPPAENVQIILPTGTTILINGKAYTA